MGRGGGWWNDTWREHWIQCRSHLQQPWVTAVPSCPCPYPGSRPSQNALLGSKRASHVPSEESPQSHCGGGCGVGCGGRAGWMEAQQQATWESQSSKYL